MENNRRSSDLSGPTNLGQANADTEAGVITLVVIKLFLPPQGWGYTSTEKTEPRLMNKGSEPTPRRRADGLRRKIQLIRDFWDNYYITNAIKIINLS